MDFVGNFRGTFFNFNTAFVGWVEPTAKPNAFERSNEPINR